MNRREFLQKGGIGVVVGMGIALNVTNAYPQQTVDEKISPDLIRMINEGKYPKFKDTKLVDVMIKYNEYPWAEDFAAIFKTGGVRGDIANHIKGVRAGLPPDLEKIRGYASRTRVMYIGPNIDGKDFYELK